MEIPLIICLCFQSSTTMLNSKSNYNYNIPYHSKHPKFGIQKTHFGIHFFGGNDFGAKCRSIQHLENSTKVSIQASTPRITICNFSKL